MDDQRDYAEERANLRLMHEECEGCETCYPGSTDPLGKLDIVTFWDEDDEQPKWDEAGYNYLLHYELPN